MANNVNEYAIIVKDVTKKFKVFLDKGVELKERLLFKNRNRYEERWVLKGISFQVNRGEAVGIIGQNGCGKSTTLKLLTKIIYPDSGSIEMRGRVSSLIELGAGFHPDMSGRENIYTNASIFGLTKKEIDQRLDDIIAFSELEDFIDNPVRTYSSGMYMRLAFSVAINVDADILLIDEILAVGDLNFQTKCFNKLKEIKANGATIVIVSHSLGQIEQICDRSICLFEGMIKADVTPRDVHPEYVSFMGEKREEIAEKERQRKDGVKEEKKIENYLEDPEKKRWGNGKARFTSVRMMNDKREQKNIFTTGENVIVEAEYKINQLVKDVIFGIGIFNGDGIRCYGTNTRIEQFDNFDLENNGVMEIELQHMNLLPGVYTLDITIESEIADPVDYYREACKFEVISNIGDVGITRIDHIWKI